MVALWLNFCRSESRILFETHLGWIHVQCTFSIYAFEWYDLYSFNAFKTSHCLLSLRKCSLGFFKKFYERLVVGCLLLVNIFTGIMKGYGILCIYLFIFGMATFFSYEFENFHFWLFHFFVVVEWHL